MGRNPPMKKLPEFAPIPMTYGDLLSSLIRKDLPVSLPKVVQPQCDLRVSWRNSGACG